MNINVVVCVDETLHTKTIFPQKLILNLFLACNSNSIIVDEVNCLGARKGLIGNPV